MPNDKLQRLTEAFDLDGYDIDNVVVHGNDMGITAKHRTASVAGNLNKRKKAYYLEGSHREMGYQLGLLAEDEIAQMTTSFVNFMIWELLFWKPRKSTDPPDPKEQTIVNLIRSWLGDLLADLMTRFSEAMAPDIPPEYLEELEGILQGCQEANPATKVVREDLWALNFGIDWFLANIYSGLERNRRLAKAVLKEAVKIKLPLMCNGFSLFGDAADGGHYFGRDFMFPTAGVFENTACLIVQRPDDAGGKARFPFVSLTAPGMMGCVSGMNTMGVAIGLELLPAVAADPDHPGFNSLLLNRYSIETGATAEHAKDAIVQARRGVPWIYVISDGANDRACAVEAVFSTPAIRFTDFPSKELLRGCLFSKPYLPDRDFLQAHQTAPQENGVMVRWHDYAYDGAYLDFNTRLFKRSGKTLPPGWDDETGYINGTYEDKNCPGMSYFAPQRETRPDVVIATNHFIIPEMRYLAMTTAMRLLFGDLAQDSQWRYDALNDMIAEALEEAGQAGRRGVDYAKAKEILDFLSPSGRYPDYYGSNKHVIEGAQSLFDLKNLTVESHYGYYQDEWVKLRLPNYVTGP